jgi:TDG/mug DNA glycosylase family protein
MTVPEPDRDLRLSPAEGLSDVLAPGLDVVFCGLNPAATALRDGHNFSSPSNRFWRTLHLAGFTPRLLLAEEERRLLDYGCGVTAAVGRATRSAQELSHEDYRLAATTLESRIEEYAPRFLAFLGKAAYASLSGLPRLEWGPQQAVFGGARVWVLPNPSGLNRAFSLAALVESYAALRKALDEKY